MTSNTLRDAYFRASQLRQEQVTYDGHTFVVRELSVAQRKQFVEVTREKGGNAAGVWLVVNTVFDTEGNRVFSDDDAAALEQASPRLAEKLGNAVLRLSDLVEEDDATLGNG
jgi:hypothetical protein